MASVTLDAWWAAVRAQGAHPRQSGPDYHAGETVATGLACGKKSGSPGACSLVSWRTWLRAGRREREVCPAGAADAGGAPPGGTRGRGLIVALERVGEGLFCMI